MQKLSATYIFTLSGPPLPNGIVVVDEDGRIADVLSEGTLDSSDVKQYDGLICPGFVNAHCHMELSHLKGLLPEKTGLDGFIKALQTVREKKPFTDAAFLQAEQEMIESGVAAVGDISNGNVTFQLKSRSTLYYHTFVEVYGLRPAQASQDFEIGTKLLHELEEAGLRGSLSPHAPYSLTPELFDMIKRSGKASPLSMHNQETASENEMFVKGSGGLLDTLKGFGIDMSWFGPSGNTSLLSVMKLLPAESPVQLVHNTYTNASDAASACMHFTKLFWCLCPSANLHIEGCLPDVEMLAKATESVTIGTDSLASNKRLSVFEEIKTLATYFPKITTDQLLRWASANGAALLGIDHRYGYIKKGMRPGLNLITGIRGMSITKESRIRKLV